MDRWDWKDVFVLGWCAGVFTLAIVTIILGHRLIGG